MKQVLGILILAVAIGGAYYANKSIRRADGKSMLHVAQPVELVVETATPEERSIVRSVQAPGEVEALAEVDISAEVVAKIVEMPVEEGDEVQKNDLLCRLDDADYRARLISAKANIARLQAAILQNEADLDKAERDLERQMRLSEADATSSTELADYQTLRTRAKASLDMRHQELVEAEARMQSATEDLARTVIRSPIDGIISQLFAKEGEVVITGTMNNPGTRIMVVSDLSKMQIRCRVDETDAPLVRAEQTARIFLQSDTRTSIPGHVVRMATKGTKPTGRDVVTFETLVLVDGDDPRVRPGMTASVEIEVARSEKALTVPVQAVVHRKRRDLPEALVADFEKLQELKSADTRRKSAEYIKVLFAVRDGVAHPLLIDTGISDDTSVEVVQGLETTETIVVGPYRSLDQLKDGSKIKPPEAQPAAEPAKPSGEAVAQG